MSTSAPAKTAILEQVTTYAEAVVAGEIIAGKPVRQACDRHLRDWRERDQRGIVWDEDRAAEAVEFVELLSHSKGEWAGQTFRLEPWQVFIVGSVFGWYRVDGRRRFREVYQEVARKNGKTTLLSAIALKLAFADGEPGAEVYTAATKKDQARLIWSEAMRMVEQTPPLRQALTITEFRSNISLKATNQKLEPLGRDSDTSSGLNPHGALIDELHEHPNRGMVDVLETAMGARRNPLLWCITTAGHDQSSIWWEKRSYALMVVEGVVDDDSVFVYVATLDDEDDWRDEHVWIKANPNLGVSVYLDKLREECQKAQEIPSLQNTFLRLRLNRPTEQAERWLDMTRWDACAGEPVVSPGDTCYVALDLASRIDLSGAIALFPRADGSYDVLARFWRPQDTLQEAEKRDRVPYGLWARQGYLELVEGTRTDGGAIARDILAWTEPYHVVEFPFDRWNADSAAAVLDSDGATIVSMAQGFQTYSEACHELEGLLLDGRIRHGGHPILRWMAGQVMVQHGPNDSMRPYKPKGSGIRDDGIVALLMALARAIKHREVVVNEPRSWSWEELPA